MRRSRRLSLLTKRRDSNDDPGSHLNQLGAGMCAFASRELLVAIASQAGAKGKKKQLRSI
eukprot:scaffold98974_cov32-Tisochrysis_lutea.AAC.3